MSRLGGAWLALGFACAAPLHGQDLPREAFVAWARANATPLPDCEGPQDAGAFAGFARIVGDARIVALGEPAHGAHQPLALRNCLFRYLVEQQGFTAIALETGLAESRRLQDYVAGGPGDARQLVRDSLSWGFWRFEENVALVAWMHGYNADPAHRRKIRFYGIDMSGGDRSGEWRDARLTLDRATAFLARTAPDRSRRARAAVAPFLPRFSASGYAAMTAGDKRRLRSAIAGLIRCFDRGETARHGAADEADFAWARQNAVLADQLEAMFRVSRPAGTGDDLAPDDDLASAARDKAMADNVRWAADREGAAGRILLFAHNGHVANAPGRGGIWSVYRHPPEAMGQYLRAAFADRLRIIATGAATNGPGLPAGPQPPGSIDQALIDTGKAPLLIDLRAAKGLARAWLQRDRTIRTNFTTESLLVPATAIDAIAFFPRLSPHSSPPGPR